ncbi:prepilin peptidase CpaA [Polaromonas sp. OV174]|uniref:A24 family peptidase n=1 Tax=Polaromonas sp. OV174 TaxID=1855300 RepID=UPI0008EBFEA3|nr:A24 family peptidase [Polaromonas sp. OV174]SFC26436.1 prepilin peptidase CpaA [Polaromonas sp. OV174]
MQEFDALLELLTALVKDPRTGVLLIFLIIASVSDFRTFRIPNWLTFSGMVFGLIYSAFVPFSFRLGFFWALGGLLLGFLIMLPCYALKIMGAGDVKLMAMVGAFLGVSDTLHAVAFSFIVGGIAALGFSLFNKALIRMLGNVKNIAQMMMMSAIGGFRPDVQIEASKSVGKLPYGICISIGTVAYVVAKQLGYA